MNKKIAHVGAIIVGVLTPVAALVTAETGNLPTNWRDVAVTGVSVLGAAIMGIKAFDSFLVDDESTVNKIAHAGRSNPPTH